MKGGIFTLMTGGASGDRPPDSMIADRNHLAVGILVAVPLLNYLRMQSATRWCGSGCWWRWADGGLALGSQSRGALIALAAPALVFWWRSRGKVLAAS